MPTTKKETAVEAQAETIPDDVFYVLGNVDVSNHVEEKDTGNVKLKYLSWAWAWCEVRARYPDATYTIVKNENNLPYFVDPGMGIMVYTTVTIKGETHEMWLPVMDGANNPMKLEPYEYQVKNYKFKYAKWNDEKKGFYDSYGNIQTEYLTKKVDAATMFDVNKTIMRCLTKNLAMFGIGLSLYAGEDLFDDAEGNKGVEATNNKTESATNSTDSNLLPLEVVRKELEIKIKTISQNMPAERKEKMGQWIEKMIGTADYHKCDKINEMNNLLNELNKMLADLNKAKAA